MDTMWTQSDHTEYTVVDMFSAERAVVDMFSAETAVPESMAKP